MRLILSLAVISAFILTSLACQDVAPPLKVEKAKTTASPAADSHNHSEPRISLAEAKKEFDAGNAVFLDTRAEVSYKQEHIKDAINIPAEAIQVRFAEVPKDKKIIAYCS